MPKPFRAQKMTVSDDLERNAPSRRQKKSVQHASPKILKDRTDYLRTAKGHRINLPSLRLQARHRGADDNEGIRVGFTCSRKVGNAVTRNRAKRRLREIAKQILPEHGRKGWDYVIIGRQHATATYPFEDLMSDLRKALQKLHA